MNHKVALRLAGIVVVVSGLFVVVFSINAQALHQNSRQAKSGRESATSIPGDAPGASAPLAEPLTITALEPVEAPNDLDTTIVITGTGFTVVLSGTEIIAVPQVQLGNFTLPTVGWVNSATLTATVPWGMNPGTYPLTVINPGGGTNSLVNAYTVKNGIGQWNSGNLFGGEGRQIIMKPGDPNTLYALAYEVGLFRSQDAGEHWAFINGDVIGNRTFVADPLHPSWLYSNDADSTYHPFSRSQDDGYTWTEWLKTWADGRSFDLGRVYPSPFNPQTIFVSASAAPGNSAKGVQGLMKSVDGGVSWHIVNDMEGIPVYDVAFHPTDSMKMVLGTQSGRVFQSSDGGEHWSEVSKPPISYVQSIVYNPYRPAEVWVSLGRGSGLYKSTDSTFTSWQNVTPADSVGNPGSLWWIKFASANSVYTVKHHSTNGGQTWENFGPWNSYGEFTFDPDNSQIGYIGDDTYGVQKTFDSGQTWEIKNHGLAGMRASQLQASEVEPRRVYATFEHWTGVFRSDDGANTWTFLPIENSYNVRVIHEDPFDPQRIYVAADSGFYVSMDGGRNWTAKGWNVPPSSPLGTSDVMQPDPYQPGHLLVGFKIGQSSSTNYMFASRLYSSNDYGDSWNPITVIPGQELGWIKDLVFHPQTSGLVYFSTDGTGMYRSTNSGSTWKRIDDPNLHYMQWLGSITIATHPQPILLVADGSDPYRSTDGGNTWQRGQAPTGYGISKYMFLNGDSTRLYAASWDGLRFSSNVGNSWAQAAGAMGRLHITAMGYGVGSNYTILYVATTGGNPGHEGNSTDLAGQFASGNSNNSINALLDHQLYLPLVLKNWAVNNMVNGGVYRFTQR